MTVKRETTRQTFKSSICFLLIFTMILVAYPAKTAKASDAPGIGASAYVLIEANSRRVLLEGNKDAKLPMASTTKILTCILAIELGDLDAVVAVDDSAVGIEGSSMYLGYGETITLRELLYGLMLSSGNDAAVAIAIHIGGSEEKFAQLMNEKARSIGAQNSNFVTPNGLHDDNHYTTAYDLAIISAYAMGNDTFAQIVSTTSIDLEADDDSPARYLRSKNKILTEVEGGNGVKTGYTKAAGRCLVAGAERDGMQLIAVVLNDYNWFDDCAGLLEYGFANYRLHTVETDEISALIPVEGGVDDWVDTAVRGEFSLPLREEEYNMVEKKVYLQESIGAPVPQGTVIGRVEYWLGDTMYGISDIVTTQTVERNTYKHNFSKMIEQWLGVA